MGIFSPNFSSRPHLDDVADSMLDLFGRQFLLGVALRIVNSAILAYQARAVLKRLNPP
jgi:hypothetical protein